MRSTIITTDLASGTRSANLLAGDINEFVTQRSQVNVYSLASAFALRMTILASSDVVMDDKPVTNIGTNLIVPDQLVESFAVAAGTRLSITLRETGAVSTTDHILAVDVIPF